jgi:3',5'-cyclic AMP phosphodiesterase CpdA
MTLLHPPLFAMRLAWRSSAQVQELTAMFALLDDAGYATDPAPLRGVSTSRRHHRGVGRAGFRVGSVRVESASVTTVLHVSDLHFGRPASSERLDALRELIAELEPDAVAVSGDLTQRCAKREFARARQYLDKIGEVAPYVVIPGNHDIRWLGAVWRNMGGLFRKQAHEFKYSRYKKFICEDLTPSLEVPGAVIAGLNTAHGITRGSITKRFRDLGVIGHVKRADIESVRAAFENASPDAIRIVMVHHNPIRGELSGRHGLANTEQALHAFASLGTELILCGHDHLQAIHNVERGVHGLVISTAGTISNRLRPGRASSFNLVTIDERTLLITTYAWQDPGCFVPSEERSYTRRAVSRPA